MSLSQEYLQIAPLPIPKFWQEEQEDDKRKETDGLNDTHGDEDDETLSGRAEINSQFRGSKLALDLVAPIE